jgi:amino acid transporter
VLVLSGSRLIYAMGEANQLARVLAATHPRYFTPHVAILVTAAAMLPLTLWSTFSKQVNLSVIARLLSYGVTCAALIVLRRRPAAPAAAFLAPAGIPVAILTMLAIAWLLSNATLLDVRDSAIAAGIGLAIFLVHRFVTRSSSRRESSAGP